LFCGAALRGSDLAAAFRPRGRGHNKCAALRARRRRRRRRRQQQAQQGRNSTHAEQAQQGRNSTLLCSITAILLRNCGLDTARVAELAAGAGVRAYGVPAHAGGLPANTGESRGGEKWTNAGIRPIRGWANRRPVACNSSACGPLDHTAFSSLTVAPRSLTARCRRMCLYNHFTVGVGPVPLAGCHCQSSVPIIIPGRWHAVVPLSERSRATR
jgi:hypothetical protein